MAKGRKKRFACLFAAAAFGSAAMGLGAVSITPNLVKEATSTAGSLNGASYTGTYTLAGANSNYLIGYETTPENSTAFPGRLIWEYNQATSSSILVGLQPQDDLTNFTYTNYNASYPAPASSAPHAIPGLSVDQWSSNTSPFSFTTNGIVAGQTTRYRGDATSPSTSTPPIGTDDWIYTPGMNTTQTVAGIYTPTLMNPTSATSANYSYIVSTAASGVQDIQRSALETGVNINSQLVGNASRYVGGTTSTSLGTDAFLSTENSPTSVTTLALGLGESTLVNAAPYAYTVSTGFFRTSKTIVTTTLQSNPGLEGALALTDSGIVAGTSLRYDNATSAGTSTLSAGTDSWIYNYGGVPTTSQVGLVGGIYESIANDPNSFTTGYTGVNQNYRRSVVSQMTPSGVLAGTSTVYDNSAGRSSDINGGPTLSGTQAWVYTPNVTPTTSTGFTNGYVQVGLYDSTGLTLAGNNIAHATPTAGGVSYGNNSVISLSKNGVAAGVATRYVTGDTSATPATRGSDAWVYTSGTGTTNVQPNALSANLGAAHVSYYQPQAPTGPGAFTVPTVSSATGGLPSNSNYVEPVGASSSPGAGNANMSILAQNDTGWTAGVINRYNTTTGAGVGQDGWVYDPNTQHEYLLESPTSSASNYASMTIYGISNNDIAVGTYDTYSGTTSTTLTGRYMFAWDPDQGLMTLDQLFSSTSSTNTTFTFQPLNNLLTGDSGWNNLDAGKTASALAASYALFIDGNGTIYGTGYDSGSPGGASPANGNTGTTGAFQNGTFAISVPEPTGMSLLAVASAAIVRRRKKS